MNFYVYEHWRPDTNTCFYVGKGNGRRCYNMTQRNKWHRAILAKLEASGLSVEVRMISEDMSEADAFALEVERIAFWKDAKITLCNLSSGGEGPAGVRQSEERKLAMSLKMMGRFVSEETRRRHSISGKGRCGVYERTDEQRAKLSAALIGKKKGKRKPLSAEYRATLSALRRGVIKSPETCAKLSAALMGHVVSDETRKKISESHKRNHANKKLDMAS